MSKFPLPTLLLSLFLLPLHLSLANQQHLVGGYAGWTIPAVGNVNYSTWADDGSLFYIGDTLLFNYDATLHDVVEVTRADYGNCSGDQPIARYDDGNTIISLDTPGFWYFICGVPGHCLAGQMVAVEVAEELPSPAPAPAIAPISVPAPVQVLAPISAPTPAPTLLSGSTPFHAPSPSPSIPGVFPSSPIESVRTSPHLKAGDGSVRARAPPIKVTSAIVSGAFLAALWLAVTV